MVHYVEIHLQGDSIHCIDHGGYETRSDSIIRLATLAFERLKEQGYKIYKRLLIFTEDRPVIVQDPNLLQSYEIYNQCDTRENADRIFPDFVFDHWNQVGIHDFDGICQSLHPYAEQEPTIDQCFWIGAITHPNRIHFLQMVQHNPYVQANINQWLPGQTTDKKETLKGTTFVSLPDHTKYRWLIDLEGNGYSGRLKILAHMKRLLFVPDRPYWDWASLQLKAGTHYVPIQRDYSDFHATFEHVRNHPDIYQPIVDTCYSFAKEHLTREKAIQRIMEIFLLKENKQ